MDTPQTALHTVAAVETTVHESKETDATRNIRGKGMEKCPESKRSLVEFGSLTYESSL